MAEARAQVKSVVAGNPGPLTLDGTRTYVLDGDPCLVVDPGPDLADHLDAVEVAVGAADVAAICITHYHPDHAAGAPELMQRLGAPLAATRESAKLAALEPPGITLAPGAPIEFGGGHLQVIEAPGHCRDHVCLYWPETRSLFTGDVILGEGTSMVAPPEGDMAAYMATLERLARLDLAVIYPGHGSEIKEPAAKIAEYAAHRRERERQVLAALASGARSPSAIRGQVYPEIDARLFPAAEGSVLAHLIKLVGEGRVRRVGGERYVLAN